MAMKKIARAVPAVVLLALAAAAALAQPPGRPHGPQKFHPQREFQRPMPLPQAGGRMSLEERRRLREDLQSARRDVYRDEERRREFERLREQARSGQISRQEAIRQYRERFGTVPPPAGGASTGQPPQPLRQDAPPLVRSAPEQAARQAEIERLREAVREGRMSPQEARERLREERLRRATEAGRFSPEEREQLRRDIQDANRSLERR
jgi:hypothetical protein